DRNDQASYVSVGSPTEVSVTLGSWGTSVAHDASVAAALNREGAAHAATGAAASGLPQALKNIEGKAGLDAAVPSQQPQHKEAGPSTRSQAQPDTAATDAYFASLAQQEGKDR